MGLAVASDRVDLGRVTISRSMPEDTDILAASLAKPALRKWLNWPEDPRQIAELLLDATEDEYAIRLDGRPVGLIRNRPELGFWLDPDFHKQGIARRAALLALSRHFAQGHDRAFATTREGNIAALRLLQALGFQYTGPLPQYSQHLGRDVPGYALLLTRADFARAQPFYLKTTRTEITPAQDQDMPALHAIATTPEAARMLLIFRPGMELVAFQALMGRFDGRPPFRAAVWMEGRVIGSIGVGKGPAPPVFYFLSGDVAGQGIASEILPAFCDELHQRYGLTRLTAEVMADNPASARVLEKAGFTNTGAITMNSKGREEPAPGFGFARDF